MTKEEMQLLRDMMKEEIGAALEPVKDDIRYTRMLVEQQDRAAQIDDVRDRLRTLETVVMNHTAAIKELRKAE